MISRNKGEVVYSKGRGRPTKIPYDDIVNALVAHGEVGVNIPKGEAPVKFRRKIYKSMEYRFGSTGVVRTEIRYNEKTQTFQLWIYMKEEVQ